MIGIMMAQREANRFRGLDCFVPAEFREGAFDELVEVMKTADDLAVALSVTNEWLADQREWPKPTDLRRLIHEENTRRRGDVSAANCPRCNGTRMVIVERGKYTGAKDCPACVRTVQPETVSA